MYTSYVRAIAHALPANVLSYADVEARFGVKETSSAARMSGIRNRRIVAPGQCASDLAYVAARRLFRQLELAPGSIDLLTFASQTPDYRIPATAAVLHGRLGLAEQCCTLDINQACSSYLQNLAVPDLFAVIVLLTLLGLVLYAIIASLRAWLTPWHVSTSHAQ